VRKPGERYRAVTVTLFACLFAAQAAVIVMSPVLVEAAGDLHVSTATAGQLHAIHSFSEELTKLMGGESLYNQSLGTTSDVYEYDRLRGREDEAPAPKRPWELETGH